eukprot:1922581-Rhodomonas_salina.1
MTNSAASAWSAAGQDLRSIMMCSASVVGASDVMWLDGQMAVGSGCTEEEFDWRGSAFEEGGAAEQARALTSYEDGELAVEASSSSSSSSCAALAP